MFKLATIRYPVNYFRLNPVSGKVVSATSLLIIDINMTVGSLAPNLYYIIILVAVQCIVCVYDLITCIYMYLLLNWLTDIFNLLVITSCYNLFTNVFDGYYRINKRLLLLFSESGSVSISCIFSNNSVLNRPSLK